MIELNISYTLKKLMAVIGYDIPALAITLGVDSKSINSYLNKHSNPTISVINKITKLIDDNGLDIYQLFDINDDKEYLFHGSKTGGIIGKISTNRSKGFLNDFDNGFYLSDSLKNAINYVLDQKEPVIYRFKKEDVYKGNIYDFSKEKNGEIDWIIYIGLNRDKISNDDNKMFFKKHYDKKFAKYDLLKGEIADSYNFDVLNDFFNNIRDLEETRQALLLANIGPQFVMKNEKYANELMWVDVYKIEKNLKDYLLNIVRRKKQILKENRDIFSNNHVFDWTLSFEEIKRKMKEEHE